MVVGPKLQFIFDRLALVGWNEAAARERSLPDWWYAAVDEACENSPGLLCETTMYLARGCSVDYEDLTPSCGVLPEVPRLEFYGDSHCLTSYQFGQLAEHAAQTAFDITAEEAYKWLDAEDDRIMGTLCEVELKNCRYFREKNLK